jgi:HK97 family phage portal protein
MIANAETPEDKSYRIIDLRGASGDGWNDSPSRGPAGVRVTPETAMQCSTVLACVRLIAENVATIPLHVFRRLPEGGKERARDLPLYRLLNQQPNCWLTSFEFREMLTAHCLLYGNSYAEIRSGSAGAVSELWPLHPSRMTVEQLEDGSLRYCYREQNGRETIYRQDQIFHLRWLSNDGVMGMLPITLSRDAIALAQALETHGGAYFGNACRLSGLMESDNPITVETAERLREQFERMHRGADRSHRTAVLPQGVHWKDVQSTNEASQFLETRQYQVIEICRAYRVDPSYVQDKTKVGYASQEQAAIDLVQQTLLPWFRRWESAITRDLVVRDDIFFAEFDTRGLLRGDLAAQANWLQTMLNTGIYSINECREVLNMNPIGADGDQRYMQMNLTTMQGIASAAAGNAGEPAPADNLPVSYTDELLNGETPPEGAVRPAGPISRSAPDAVGVGDFVSWNSSGGRGRGKIDRVVRDGTINVPGSDFNIEGTEDDPAALISVYQEVVGGWKQTDTQVGHKFSTLTQIDPLPEPPPEEKAQPKRRSRKRG